MALDLEKALVDFSDSLEFPGEEELATSVMARLAEPGRGADLEPFFRRPVVRRALAVAAAAVLIIAIVLAISPRARRVAADLLGIGGVEIRTASSSSPPGSAPLTFPTTLAPEILGLGRPVTVADGAAGLGIVAPVPTRLGPPQATYLGSTAAGDELTLVWPPGPRLPASKIPGVGALVVVFRGDVDERFFAKTLDPGTTYESASVNGEPAVWLGGAPHSFLYPVANGSEVRTEQLRLAGNTLIWTKGPFTYRLESALDRDAAIAVAESVPA